MWHTAVVFVIEEVLLYASYYSTNVPLIDVFWMQAVGNGKINNVFLKKDPLIDVCQLITSVRHAT